MMMVLIHAEERGDRVYVVVYMEERGGMMTEERSDMMMMVVPTQLFSARN